MKSLWLPHAVQVSIRLRQGRSQLLLDQEGYPSVGRRSEETEQQYAFSRILWVYEECFFSILLTLYIYQ